VSPVRHVPSARPLALTSPGERPPGAWRYTSHLALVLSGGGARGAYQVGVLAGLAERLPGLEFPILAGMSVGAINTIYLAAHHGPLPAAVTGLHAAWGRLSSDAVYRVRPGRLARSVARWLWHRITGGRGDAAAFRGLADTWPLREFLTESLNLGDIDANIAAGRLRAVALSALSYTSGRSVTFVQGARDLAVWQRAHGSALQTRLTLDHVMASAAVPILFPAIRIENEYFGDGSVRQTAPLAPALHLGARAMVAIGLKTPRAASSQGRATVHPTVAQALGLLFDAVFLDALDADAEGLERVNRLLAALPPEAPLPDGLRPVELLLLQPMRDLGDLAAGQGHLLPRGMRNAVRAIGGHREAAAELLSFLLFHPNHTSRLIEAGYDDVRAQWPVIERFFEKLDREAKT